MRARLIIYLYLISTSIGLVFSQPILKKPPNYRNDQIVIKWKHENDIENDLIRLKDKTQIKAVRQLREQSVAARSAPSILDHIYILNVPIGTDILTICDSLQQLNHIQYAEPIYSDQLLEIPNDPAAQPNANQYYLENIKAYNAWNVSRGDSSILIGVLDTGSDLDHVDLINKYYLNPEEAVNGLDDDNNGFIDDFLGYDFANQDIEPEADLDHHGTRVAGIIGASTNNSLGIAGIAYHSKIIPLKVFKSENNQSFGSHDAIKYAADNGFDVINLSYGAVNNYSQFMQDIITYAAVEKDVVIVAAAGNTPDDLAFFPASYDHVLSVAALDANDHKAAFATFHTAIDLSAPGVSIYSTQNNNLYGSDNGSSYAAPMVAGAAALVKSHFPDLSAKQVAARLKYSTDDIYTIPANENYKGKLGTGRLNIHKALTAVNLTGLDVKLSDVIHPYPDIYFGDTVHFNLEITNLLDPVYALEVTFSSNSPYVTPLVSGQSVGYLSSGKSQSIGPFSFLVSNQTPSNADLSLVIHLSDESRHDSFHSFTFTSADEYYTLKNDSLAISIAENGKIGFAQDGFHKGVGYNYFNQLTKNIGFFIQYNDTVLLDHLPNIPNQALFSNDFTKVETIRPYSNTKDESYTFISFEDTSKKIHIDSYAVLWDSLPSKALGITYRLTNKSTDTLRNVSTGLLADFDTNFPKNSRGVVAGDSLVYAFDSLDSYHGIKILSDSSIHIILDASTFPDTLSKTYKNTIISTASDSIGFNQLTNTAMIGSSFRQMLFPGESHYYQMILAAGDSASDLFNQFQLAQKRMELFKSVVVLDTTLFACDGGALYIIPELGVNHYFFSDPLGIDTLAYADSLYMSQITSDTAIYISRAGDTFTESIKEVKINLLKGIAQFQLVSDTVYLGDYENNKIQITDQSFEPINWYWDFGNGTQASGIQHPKPVYNTPGTYTISLSIDNAQGCSDEISKQLIVLERPPQPNLGILGYCPGKGLELSTIDTLKYYPFSNSAIALYEGTQFSLSEVKKDTTIYVSRLINGLESKKSTVSLQRNPTSLTLIKKPYIDSLQGLWAQFYFQESYVNEVVWKLDTLPATSDKIGTFLIQSDTLQLHYEVVTDSSCRLSKLEQIILGKSPKPTIDSMQVCLGSSILLAPENGLSFGFYNDSLLLDPVYKGNQLMIDSLVTDRQLYIACLDSILPGAITPLFLEIIDYSFEIIASSDTLYLNQGRSISFNVSQQSQTITWFIDSIQQTIAQNPTFFFQTSGTYQVTAHGIHEAGCEYSDSLQITVIEEYNEPLALSQNETSIRPIPAENILIVDQIKDPEHYSISIFDLSGKSYPIKRNQHIINIEAVPDGIFIIEFIDKNGDSIRRKGIKKSKD